VGSCQTGFRQQDALTPSYPDDSKLDGATSACKVAFQKIAPGIGPSGEPLPEHAPMANSDKAVVQVYAIGVGASRA